jgi:hypothetical protein
MHVLLLILDSRSGPVREALVVIALTGFTACTSLLVLLRRRRPSQKAIGRMERGLGMAPSRAPVARRRKVRRH